MSDSSLPEPSLDDPYQLLPEHVEDPPRKFGDIFRQIGPGLILASSIVGSGELVATTVLGAESGYTLLWLILVSCTIKVAVQNEIGRYTIGTGETSLEAFNRVPGPRWRASWVVWVWFVGVVMSMFSAGGIMGAIAEVLNTMVPAIPVNAWVWIVNIATVILLVVGRYALIEKVAVSLVVIFTALTVSAAVLLSKSPEYFSWASVLDGLSFHLPQAGLVTAVTVFGLTGANANDLIQYSYWCTEKGYARFAGPRDDTDAWRWRARGWIRVMGVDVLSSMVVYTFATVAFYFLGAGILHGMGIIPQGSEVVAQLSSMYTQSLGDWSFYPFMMGAFAVFYSSLFAGTAAFSLGVADFMGMLGAYDKRNYRARLRVTHIAVVVLLFLPTVLFLFFQKPVLLVKIGGVAQALMLPMVGFSTVYLRYAHLPKAVLPKGWLTLALWVTSAVMLVMMGYSVLQGLV